MSKHVFHTTAACVCDRLRSDVEAPCGRLKSTAGAPFIQTLEGLTRQKQLPFQNTGLGGAGGISVAGTLAHNLLVTSSILIRR